MSEPICPRGHLWNDYGALGGRNVSWCCRCDALAFTGKETNTNPAPSDALPATIAAYDSVAAFDAGWAMCVTWSMRHDLAADRDSSAYRKERAEALAKLPVSEDAQDAKALAAENDKLRAMLGNGNGPCVYCDLPKPEWSKCASGFPGCGRADDAMLCPHVAAALDDAQDAKRYRWLTYYHPTFEIRQLASHLSLLMSVRGKDHVDAAIDAAMKETK